MQNLYNTQIDGEFMGFNEYAIFKLMTGQVWQQAEYKYNYHYAYCPRVQIYLSNGSHILNVEGMNESVKIVEVDLLSEGKIVSKFTGYDSNMEYEFQNGQVWIQTEGKYKYHYAHMPDALVVNGFNGVQLQVEGMEDVVRVRRK